MKSDYEYENRFNHEAASLHEVHEEKPYPLRVLRALRGKDIFLNRDDGW